MTYVDGNRILIYIMYGNTKYCSESGIFFRKSYGCVHVLISLGSDDVTGKEYVC